MKWRNRLLAALCTLAILCTTLPMGLINVVAEAEGDYTYTLINNGTEAEITKYSGNGDHVTIPTTLGGKPVTSIGAEAFWQCASLIGVTIPDSVTSIGERAFYDCYSLTSITIPDGVTSIGAGAFNICSSLTSITIPDGVTSIGAAAFLGCSSLTSVTIPDSVTSIGEEAFQNCDSLTSVTIPNSVTSIGARAFFCCSSLSSITIPNSVTSIGGSAFLGTAFFNDDNWEKGVLYLDSWLIAVKDTTTSCTIKAGTKNIADSAFIGCGSLTRITIPDGVTSIGAGAFHACSSLSSVTIPDSVTNIGANAFRGCSSLTSITIPDGVTSIGAAAFHGCSSLTSITIPNSVTSIGAEAFCGCSSLTSVTIPDGVTSIGGSAFSGCTRLSDITISSNTTHIGGGAFWNTALLEDKSNWTDGALYFGSHLIEVAANIQTFTIREGTTAVAYDAFYGCTALKEITFPNSLASIGGLSFNDESSGILPDEGVFNDCTSLVNIFVSEENECYTDIDGVLFNKDKTALLHYPAARSEANYSIPDGVTRIGYGTFRGCTSLTGVKVPSSVTSIGGPVFPVFGDGVVTIYGESGSYAQQYAKANKIPFTLVEGFFGYETIEETTDLQIVKYIGTDANVTIPATLNGKPVTAIGAEAFAGCKALRKVTIPEGVTTIDTRAFADCTSLTGVTMPATLETIGDEAFTGCSSMRSFLIPDGVTTIGKQAFAGCTALTGVAVPASVTKIGDQAFSGCPLAIYGDKGSYAQTYAEEWDILFSTEVLKKSVATDIATVEGLGDVQFVFNVFLVTEQLDPDTDLSESAALLLASANFDEYSLFDITLKQDYDEIQPDGRVKVALAVPEDYDGERCHVFRAEEDGTLTDMDAVYDNGQMLFATEHFSHYIVAQSSTLAGDVDGNGKVNTTDARLTLQYAAGRIAASALDLTVADVDRNGKVNTTDARLILQKAAGRIKDFS